MDSTRAPDRCPLARLALRAAVCAACVALAGASLPTPSRADGDPASDILVSQSLFLPQDARVPPAQQAQLGALLQAARTRQYRIRVALIASRQDLGSVTELWHQPQDYARFLGQELSLVYGGPLLVVMPGGFGLYRPGGGAPGALTGVRAPAAGALATAALTAIRRLAAAAGHPLPAPSAAASSTSSSGDAVPWVVFALGGLVIAGAWGASLRARPPRLRNRTSSSA